MKATRPGVVLRRKMRRQTLRDWKQYLAIIMMGAIAVTLFVGLLSNALSLSQRVDAFYASGDTPDCWVLTNSHDQEDEDYIKGLLEEGDRFDKRFQTTAKLNSSSAYMVVTDTIPTLSHPIDVLAQSEDHSDTDFFFIDKGLWKQDGKDSAKKIAVGDDAAISVSFGAYLNVPEFVLNRFDDYVKEGGKKIHREKEVTMTSKVTAIMTFPENIQTSTFSTASFLLSTTKFKASLQSLLQENYTQTGIDLFNMLIGDKLPPMNEYLISLKDSSHLPALENSIREYFTAKKAKTGSTNFIEVLDRDLNPWSINADIEVTEATQLTFVFPMVFFFVALLVILTTASQIIIKERTQIGTMKAIGLTKREIYWHYLSIIFSLVTVATAIGFVVGPLLIPTIMASKYDLLYTLPARSLFVFPWWQALLTYAIFAGLSLLVAFISCRKEIRLSPAESMRASPVEYRGFSRNKNDKPKSASLLSLKMAFRNIAVSKYKSFMVTAGVTGCTALLVCGFGIENTLVHSVDHDMQMYYTGDLSITYSMVYDSPHPAFADDPNVKSYDQLYSATTKASSDSSSVTATFQIIGNEHPFYHIDAKPGTVAISAKMSADLGLNVGDEVRWSISDGSILSQKIGLVYTSSIVHAVVGFYDDFPDFKDKYTAAWVNAADGVSAETLKETILKTMPSGLIDQMQSRQDTQDRMNRTMSGISLMTTAVKCFAIALAVVVLYNLSLLNFRERTRDIATMKVLGFSLVEIGLSLVMESLLLTLIGIVLGSLAGFPFMFVVLYVNRVSLIEFLYFIQPATYFVAFALTFLVALGVNIYFSFLTKRVMMVESLKSVE